MKYGFILLLVDQSWNVFSYLFNGNSAIFFNLHEQLLKVMNMFLLNLLLGVKSFTLVVVQFEDSIVVPTLNHGSVEEGDVFFSFFEPLDS